MPDTRESRLALEGEDEGGEDLAVVEVSPTRRILDAVAADDEDALDLALSDWLDAGGE